MAAVLCRVFHVALAWEVDVGSLQPGLGWLEVGTWAEGQGPGICPSLVPVHHS